MTEDKSRFNPKYTELRCKGLNENEQKEKKKEERTHPAPHPESWIQAVCLPQMRENLKQK